MTPQEELCMDVLARDRTRLRLTVSVKESGRVELDNPIKVAELRNGRAVPLTAYTVQGFLAAADDRGQLTLHDQIPGLTIDRHWMLAAGDWLHMLAEDLTGSNASGVSTP